ncbi:hypothetical protein HCN44_000467 [Aphidius gifuensis]|uniref:E3 ubiquitin-protein ligase listerin n=2 Tax=Aphidius gifuensis TaxID=684658 RepID=A0A835CNV8_APHGI|nr:E3 ubiquitin-protein ligase listerin isoform X2 [Aphidius gifuensis]XP_044011952.1 E3 ubiquitin-protein ligase listerin isoform X2 [Aphidius gifuensis]KAF7990662.1 hypothetical protein HCN44_000467 [Aphidius gifuensis]
MGKNKSQRTKNNTKPSNSSRSAELLSKAMSNVVGFSVPKDCDYVQRLSIGNLNDIDIDQSFQLVLKKMTKKDATTKFKALQEFSQMCNESSIEIVESILPFWPRHYLALSVDLEHRVREAAQLAHASLVKRAGRNIAIYLKRIAGVWFTSQFDTYPLTASAAMNSFNDTFPDKKLNDAIIYCQNEILSYIRDNIIVQTPQTMNTNKLLTPEELETKYQRILICSLQSYSYYHKRIPPQQIEKTMHIHQQIISNTKFWKLSKHENTLIKTAFFNVLSSIINTATSLINDEKKRAMTSIMNCLDDSDPGILSAVWECIVIAIDKINDWHNSVSTEKLVLPKLWRVLKNGGQGCASVVYPSLLPLLSQFHKFNSDDKKNCYYNFFDNMKIGFSQKTVQMSRSEIFSITKSFVECFRYTVLLNNDDLDFCSGLLQNQLMPLIESCMLEYSKNKKIMFHEVTQLVRYWSKNRENKKYQSYQKLVELFWIQLEKIFFKLSDSTMNNNDEIQISNIFHAKIELLTSLQYTPVQSRHGRHVQFADCDDFINRKEIVEIISNNNDEAFDNELVQLVSKVCINFLNNIENENSRKRIDYLNQLTLTFESEKLFIEMTKGNESLFEFYNKNLKNWLAEKKFDSNSVVQLTFMLYSYMTDYEKKMILDSLNDFDDDNILSEALTVCLVNKNRKDYQINNWLKQQQVTDYLIKVSKKICDKNETEKSLDVGLIILAFRSINSKVSVNQEAIDGIASVFCEKLNNHDELVDNPMVDLVLQLLELTWTHQDCTSGSLKLLRSLFGLTLHDNISLSVKKKTRENWKSGLKKINKKLLSDKLLDFQSECISILFKKLYSSSNANVDDMVDIVFDFIESSCYYDYYSALSMMIQFNLSQKHIFTEWIPQVADLILYGEILSGYFHLSNPIRSLPVDKPMTYIISEKEVIPDKTESCLQWALLNVKLLIKLLVKLADHHVAEDSSDKGYLADLHHIINSILLIVSLSDLYGNHYKSAKNYDSIKKLNELLNVDCIELRKKVPKFIWGNVLNESKKVDDFWIEFGSIFNQFLRHYYLDDKHLLEIKLNSDGKLRKFLELDNNLLTLAHHINAVVLARNLVGGRQHDILCRDVLIKIIKRCQNNNFLLVNANSGIDVDNVSWEDFYLPLEVIRLFTQFVKTAPTVMNSTLWDAVCVYLASWQFSVNKSKHNHHDLKVQCFIVAVSNMFCEVQSLMNRHEKNTICELPPTLLSEWNDVFAEDIHRGIVTTWMYYADLYNKKNDYLMPIVMLNYLGNAVKLLNGNLFFKTDSGNTSPEVTSNELIKFSFKLSSSSVPSLQLSSYFMLNRMIPKLVELDKNSMDKDNFDSKTLIISNFKDSLKSTQNIVDAMLSGLKLCDNISCTIQSYTDSYTYTLAYLLVWANVLEICSHAHADLRYQYAEKLKDDFFPSLLNNIFRLMPAEILQETKSRLPIPHLSDIFKNPPVLNFNQSLSDLKIDHIACWIYVNCLRFLPVAVRQWWSTLDPKASSVVEKITMLYVTPILCQEELLKKRIEVPNMVIKVHPSAREVIALYQMDDTRLELNMVLPVNYPLGPVSVEPGQYACGAANWKNCHMQLSIFLTHQNGSIWDGLMMWKKNLDKKFAGVEECYICFSIFHINTYQIPKLSCHTCRKKFHAPCLYKWFSTSQKSTCPICRNIF